MNTQKNSYFWEILERFNYLMKESIEGPDCIKPENCHGDCCSIKIDVPRVLAEWYIEKGFAKESDFIHSDAFSFHLRFDEKTGKCFLFDKKRNGCSVHNTGRKPPQCWIYPTGFSNSLNKNISCKRLTGWKITNQNYTKEAENLLKKYVFLCQIEALKERKNIRKRLENSLCKDINDKSMDLRLTLKNISPSKLGGFKDSWNEIKYLSAQGFSLQMKKFCAHFNPNCEFSNSNFLKCNNMCDKIITKLILFLDNHIMNYIWKYGVDCEGEYPLFKLFNEYLR